MKPAGFVRTLYVYGFSLIGLVLVVIGTVRLLDLGLKTYVFTKADQYVNYPYPEKIAPDGTAATMSAVEKGISRVEQEEAEVKNKVSRNQATASSSLAMIIVGAPLFVYHWRIARKSS